MDLRVITAILAAAGMVFSAGCMDGNAASVPAADTAAPVRVAPVTSLTPTERYVFPGVTRAVERAVLTFKVPGSVQQQDVQLGQAVKAGDTLMTLYNPEILPARNSARARVDELRARAGQAQRDFVRVETLREQGAASQEELERARAAADALGASVATARAQLEQANRLVAELTIKAPFAGTVEKLFFEEGEFVGAGQPAVAINNRSRQEIEIAVPESLVASLAVGDRVEVAFPMRSDVAPVSGSIHEIADSVSQPVRLYPVVVHFDAAVPTGTASEIALTRTSADELAVPLRAVVDTGRDGTFVYAVRDGAARRVPVNATRIIGNRVTVSGKLSVDEPVIFAGIARVTDGDAVDILP